MKSIYFILLLVSQLCVAQTFEKGSEALLIADSFVGIDPYNNTYYTKDFVLHKEGPDGSFVFNDLQLGTITSVDIINPLKVVVFYEDTNTVVLLDNKLSEMERISFNNLPEFINVSTATNAGNNRLWIFNIDTQQLELYNYRDNRKTTVSQPFEGKLISQASNFNYCFTLTEFKFRTFNVYGSLLSEKDNNGFTKVVQHNETRIALKENQLYTITEDTITPIKLPVSENTIKDLQLTQDFLYIYDGKTLHTLSITQPKK
ncbi:hypothetical protein [Cochleicola gelatinilyticus]|uniref:Glutamine cyclotransferase n=1 Tax=Cochleicola gelatinilyticus TaxID=1763537 RepID=A0A167IJI1_9FLAO|nr:hypothetical protein [Cochleicola gelatinilyticus]OAB79718.1 hypothetical protein ULVI_02950 [Cochleicola gelatinilyticus]